MTAAPFLDPRTAFAGRDPERIAELSLSRLTDKTTYGRALQYADNGAVVELVPLEGSDRFRGRVTGSRRNIYTCVVRLTQAPSGVVTALAGVCSCPMTTNCKHVFALAIMAFRDGNEPQQDDLISLLGASQRPVRAVLPQPAPWKRTLSALLDDDRTAASDADGAELGLQIELVVAGRAGARGGQTGSTPVRVGLRPVMVGAKGNWIRTGISWDRLGSYNHQRRPPRADHLQLLREITAVDSASRAGRYYGYNETFIYLEDLNSPRIWDLLAETRNVGVALVQSGRDQRPVTLSNGQGEISLDVGRVDGQLVVGPSIAVDGDPAGPVNFALLGTPLHGVALWPNGPATDLNNSGLTLVRSTQPLTAELRNLLTGPPIQIPRPDEETFVREFLPLLARRVPTVSRDGSFDIPEPKPPRLSLTVTGLPGHRVDVEWEWLYPLGETTTTLSLWPSGADSLARDRDAERAVLESLSFTEGEGARLTAPSHLGPRLLPSVTLGGLDAVAFFGETLPRLRDLPGLDLTVINELSFREAVEEPVISISNSQKADDRDWFELGITVTIENEKVPFNGLFLALAAADECMILPSGTYFPLNCEPFLTLRRLIEEARALEDVPGRSLKINRYQASLWQELVDLGVVKRQAAAWKKSVGGLLAGDQIIDRPIPETLKATLRPYQQTGFNWLTFLFDHDLGGVLADDMGLGKTVQTLALVCHARAEKPDAEPFLVVAPTSVVGNWAAECARFAPGLRVVAITETLTRSGLDLAGVVNGADLVITSYALFRLDYDEYSDRQWSGLILDEAQFIKNHLSKGYHCAKKLSAPFKLAITGTPMENNLLELWSLFSVTAPGLFAQSARFKEYYQGPIEKDGDSDRLAQLRRRIRPLMLRRTKEQVVKDLPAKQEQVIELELNPAHRKVYQTHLQRERQKVLGLIDDMKRNRFAILRSLTLLRQLSLDAGLVDPKYAKIPSTKLDALMEQVADVVAEGHRTLIFSQFTGFLDKVRQRMDAAGVDYCYLDGKTRHRPAVLAEFKSGTAPVFLISLKAGGVGLNLTEADYCILLDPWWNPATEAQAVDRIHRIGQTRNVMVYRLVAKDTIEEKVMALKATKAKLFSSVMESGSAQSTALTATDIRELLS